MQVDKFSLLLSAVTVLSAFLQQLHWPISSLSSNVLDQGNHHQHHKKKHAAQDPLPGGAKVRPSSCATRALLARGFSHSWAPVPLHPTTAIIPAQMVFCSNKSSLRHCMHSGLGVSGARRIARETHGASNNMRKKARQTPVLVPDTTHLTKVWVHVPLPGQSSQSTCSEGSIKLLLSRHHPYLQRSKQGTQTQSLQGTPVFLHTATSPHYR